MKIVGSYTNEELRRIAWEEGNGRCAIFPDRGQQCPRCHTHIPIFAELSELARVQVLALIRAGKECAAIERLQRETGCSARWAKIWVLHAQESNCLWLDEQTLT